MKCTRTEYYSIAGENVHLLRLAKKNVCTRIQFIFYGGCAHWHFAGDRKTPVFISDLFLKCIRLDFTVLIVKFPTLNWNNRTFRSQWDCRCFGDPNKAHFFRFFTCQCYEMTFTFNVSAYEIFHKKPSPTYELEFEKKHRSQRTESLRCIT